MVKSVQVISKTQRSFPLSAEIQNGKLSFDLSVLDDSASESFDLVVTFTSSIQSFRNQDSRSMGAENSLIGKRLLCSTQPKYGLLGSE